MLLKDIKNKFDKDFCYSRTTRERGSDDSVFFHITQWDNSFLEETQLSYRGEFNILRKAGRGIQADLAGNPVQNDFVPRDESREDSAEIADGLYRAGLTDNTSIEAFSNAQMEMVVCGFGAWGLHTEYESLKSGSNNQIVRRFPIYEANNTVFFDAGAKLLDKSDAGHVTQLTAYTEDGYKKLTKELTGEEKSMSAFAYPEKSWVFPWISGTGANTIVHVGSFYHRELIKDKILTYMSPVGQEIQLYESALKDVMDDMLNEGFEFISDKEVKRWEVRKYILYHL